MPKGLFRPTTATPETPPEQETAASSELLMTIDEPIASDADEPQGRGEPAAPGEPRAPKSRRKRPTVTGETKGRKLNLSDAIYDRLQLAAIQKRTTVSAVAADILERNLPRLRIERDA
jgi:hypothetical protein